MKLLRNLVIVLALCSLAATCPSPSPTPAPITIAASSVYWSTPVANTSGTPLVDLSGFKIYAGLSPGTYSIIYNITSPSVNSIRLNMFLNSPGTYYLSMTAYDFVGVESAKSPETRFTAQ